MTAVEELKAIADPDERARLACAELSRLGTLEAQVRDVRDFAINELVHVKKLSLRAVADRYGISKSQVANIVG